VKVISYENFKILSLFGNFQIITNSKSDFGLSKKILKWIHKQSYMWVKALDKGLKKYIDWSIWVEQHRINSVWPKKYVISNMTKSEKKASLEKSKIWFFYWMVK